ncbi:MAG: threonine synthase [Clostridiales bacterium]|nr:threonine synthase [Clostridiales bacterium]
MQFISTRGGEGVSAAHAILQGLAPDGGLYMPEGPLPRIEEADGYIELAARTLQGAFGDSYSEAELTAMCQAGYGGGRFSDPQVVPLAAVGNRRVLELFHGPTASFKDIALSLLPPLMAAARDRLMPEREILVLTATSGDTGSATMAGFEGMPGIRVIVFYPQGGVSPVQEAQMLRLSRGNLRAVAIRGDFDQAQQGVKHIFAQGSKLVHGVMLSSANSINIGRLLPQMVYYAWAAQQLQSLTPLIFSVPTGNFGDIFAGTLAMEAGLPAARLLVATNANRVLKDALETGVYDRRRRLTKTLSPSMDILVSSNFERALYLALEGDTVTVRHAMQQLELEGHMVLPPGALQAMQRRYGAAACSDAQALEAMAKVWDKHGYLMDPHTASAWHALDKVMGEGAPGVVLSTASPYKFPEAALRALGLPVQPDVRDQWLALRNHTNLPVPQALQGLLEGELPRAHVIDPEHMAAYVQERAAAW